MDDFNESAPSSASLPPERPSLWYVQAMERLVGVVQELSMAHDLPAVMAVVRLAARELTGADGATFVLRDDGKCFYAEENAIAPLWKGLRFPMTACISGWAMIHKEPAIIPDIYVDPRIPIDAYRPTFVKSLAMVPIRTRDPVGAIGNYWATKRRPTQEEVRVLQALADTTAVAMENVRVFAELEKRIRDMAVLTQAAPIAIVSLDREALVTTWNPAAAWLFGVEAEKALGSPLCGIAPDGAEAFARLLAAIRDGATVAGETLVGRRSDGKAIDLRLWGGPVMNEDGSLRAILLVMQDETERNQLERQYRHAQKMQAVGQLTGGLAHDFNNMLVPILNLTKLVADDLEETDRNRVRLLKVMEASERARDLVASLMAFSRKDEAPSLQALDLARLVRQTVPLLRSSLPKSATLEDRIDDLPATILGDRAQMTSLLMNLVGNARDAMEGLNGRIAVTLSETDVIDGKEFVLAPRGTGRHALLRVEDTGKGMDRETLNNIFMPFFTTKEQGRGTGLGLAMVHGTVGALGGGIRVDSEPGRGTVFELVFPFNEDASAGGAA